MGPTSRLPILISLWLAVACDGRHQTLADARPKAAYAAEQPDSSEIRIGLIEGSEAKTVYRVQPGALMHAEAWSPDGQTRKSGHGAPS